MIALLLLSSCSLSCQSPDVLQDIRIETLGNKTAVIFRLNRSGDGDNTNAVVELWYERSKEMVCLVVPLNQHAYKLLDADKINSGGLLLSFDNKTVIGRVTVKQGKGFYKLLFNSKLVEGYKPWLAVYRQEDRALAPSEFWHKYREVYNFQDPKQSIVVPSIASVWNKLTWPDDR